MLDGLEGALARARRQSSSSAPSSTRLLSGLDKRVFLMNNIHDGAPRHVPDTRWALSYLCGPLIALADQDAQRALTASTAQAGARVASEHAPTCARGQARAVAAPSPQPRTIAGAAASSPSPKKSREQVFAADAARAHVAVLHRSTSPQLRVREARLHYVELARARSTLVASTVADRTLRSSEEKPVLDLWRRRRDARRPRNTAPRDELADKNGRAGASPSASLPAQAAMRAKSYVEVAASA